MKNMASLYKAAEEHLSCDLNGDAVILNMKNGSYYGLNSVGASIWNTLQNPVSFEEIKVVILKEYDVDDATCEIEVKSFLERMTREELIEIIDEKSF